jgi:hypothetical protein
MGANQQGLGVFVGYAPDARAAVEIGKVGFEACAERGVLDGVDFALEPAFLVEIDEACAFCSQMGMVINAEKHVEYAIFF